MSDVALRIEVMIESYRQDSGHLPAGLILGPPEYRALCDRAKRSPDFLRQSTVGEGLITEYKGFPVFVKEMPGIDLMIQYQEAFHAAYR